MEAFVALRKAAREKRDGIIKQAQAAYTATLTRIAALERDVLALSRQPNAPNPSDSGLAWRQLNMYLY